MATVVKKLDLDVGEAVEIKGSVYEIVPDREGGVALEPRVTSMADLDRELRTQPADADAFEQLTADDPTDAEG